MHGFQLDPLNLDHRQREEARTHPDSAAMSQMLEDERIALMLQNEEFMAELRGDREFMSALQQDHEELYGYGGGGGASSVDGAAAAAIGGGGAPGGGRLQDYSAAARAKNMMMDEAMFRCVKEIDVLAHIAFVQSFIFTCGKAAGLQLTPVG